MGIVEFFFKKNKIRVVWEKELASWEHKQSLDGEWVQRCTEARKTL